MASTTPVVAAKATPKTSKLRASASEFVFAPSVASPLITPVSSATAAAAVPPLSNTVPSVGVAPLANGVATNGVTATPSPSTVTAAPAVTAAAVPAVAAVPAKKKKSSLRASAAEFVMPGDSSVATLPVVPETKTVTAAVTSVPVVTSVATVPVTATTPVVPVATPVPATAVTPVVTPSAPVASTSATVVPSKTVATPAVAPTPAPAKAAVATTTATAAPVAAPKKSAWGTNRLASSLAPTPAPVAAKTTATAVAPAKVAEEPKAAKKEEKVEAAAPATVTPPVAAEEDDGWEQAPGKKKKGKKGKVEAPKKGAAKQAAAAATPAPTVAPPTAAAATPVATSTPVVAPVTAAATPVATPAPTPAAAATVAPTPATSTPVVTPVVPTPVVAAPAKTAPPVATPASVAAKVEAPKLSAKAKKEEKKKQEAAAAAAAAAAAKVATPPVTPVVVPIVAPTPVVATPVVAPIVTSPSPPAASPSPSPVPAKVSSLAARKMDAANKMAAQAAAPVATPAPINTTTPLPSPTATSAAAAANGSGSVAPSPLPSPLGPLSPSPVSELKVEATPLPTGPPAPVVRDPSVKYVYDRATLEAIAASMSESSLPWALLNLTSGQGEFFPRNDRTPSGGTPGNNWRPNGAPDRRPPRDANPRYRDAPNGGRGGPLRTPRGGRDARDPRRGPRDAPVDNTPYDPLAAPSENRYQVARNVEGDAKILRDFKSILNKLTPEKFEPLLERTLALDINRVEMLRDIVQSVFEKALTEPAFCPTYADFCKALGDKMLVVDPSSATSGDDTKKESFRRLILNRCQVEFSTFFGDAAAAAPSVETPTDTSSETNGEAAPVVETEEQKKHKLKRRMLGTIRFIGELYYRGMIAEKIMKDCIRLLAKDDTINNESVDEESIEALCNLLGTVGKKLEVKGKDALDPVFVILTTLSENRTIPSRLRFMVKDSLDLRKNGWVQRIQKAEAKKLSDLHKDHEEKQRAAEEAAKRAAASASSRGGGGQGFRRGGGADRFTPKNLPSPSPRKPKVEQSADGWQSQTSSRGLKAPVRGASSVTVTSSRGGKTIGRGASTASSRGASAVAKKGVAAGDKQQVSAEVGNAYDALEDDEADEGNDARSPTTRGAAASEEEPKAEPELEEEGDADEKTLEDAREQIHQITREFIEAWVPGVNDSVFKEARERSKLISNIRSVSQLFVTETLKLACEGKEPLRNAAPVFLTDLCEEKILSDTQIVKGLTTFMTTALDFAMDCPKLWEFMANMLSPLIVAERLPISFFTSEAVEPIEDSRGKLLVDVLAAYGRAKSVGDAVTAWKSLNLTVDDLKDYFMPRDATPEAIKKAFTAKNLGDIAQLL